MKYVMYMNFKSNLKLPLSTLVKRTFILNRTLQRGKRFLVVFIAIFIFLFVFNFYILCQLKLKKGGGGICAEHLRTIFKSNIQ